MGGLEGLKQQLAVHLTVKQDSKSIDKLLEAHSHRFKDSPLFQVFPMPGSYATAEPTAADQQKADELAFANLLQAANDSPASTVLIILYAVEGMLDPITRDSCVFVLDRATRVDFQTHVALARPMTFALITSVTLSPSDGPPPDQARDVEDMLTINRIDVLPSSAVMSSFKAGMTILTRMSHSMERAKDALESLDRAASADAEGALTDCCVWLQDSVALIQEQFESLVGASETCLQVLEAYMKRYTVLKQLTGIVQDPAGVFARLINCYVGAGGPALLQYHQRATQLTLLMNEFRTQAMWASVLSKVCMSLKFAAPRQAQSLDAMASLMPLIVKHLTVVFAAAGACQSVDLGDADDALQRRQSISTLPFLHTLRQRFLPLLARNVLEKCGEYLSLNTFFTVEAVVDANEQQGYIMPLCTRPSMGAKLGSTSAFVVALATLLHRLGSTLEAHFPPPTFQSFRQPSSSGSDGGGPSDDVVGATLCYAGARCHDLLRMIRDIDEVGCGMMTKEVRCLFDTMHLAATSFPLLDGAHHKNWQRFVDVFDKSRTLKYVLVEPTNYQPLEVATQQPQQKASSVSVTARTALVPGGDDGDEEKRILRSRVTILSAELTESRELLTKATSQLQQVQSGLVQAEEMNVVLMQELRRLMSAKQSGGPQYGPGTLSYDALIESLAAASFGGGQVE